MTLSHYVTRIIKVMKNRKDETITPKLYDTIIYRMIDARGKGLVTETILTKNIKNIAKETETHYPVATRQLLNWLQ